MCGIVGYLGTTPAAPILLKTLKHLEYRGYDSAGIALLYRGALYAIKQKGDIASLENKIRSVSQTPSLPARAVRYSRIGIGHTRWATHGAPSPQNAHPHIFGKFAVVHNGIIENFEKLKAECLLRGETFASDTDSEVIAHLLAYHDRGNFIETLQNTCKMLEGSYAIAALSLEKKEIAFAKSKSPLALGKGKDGLFAASDTAALLQETNEIFSLSDGEFALFKDNEIKFFNETGEISKIPMKLAEQPKFPQLCGYSHYMRKEMAEIPVAIGQTVQNLKAILQKTHFCIVLCLTEYIQFVGCGTAYHSCVAAKYAVEALCRIPAETSIASEYRYRDPVVPKHTLLVAVSQSGETADTLAAARLAKRKGAFVLAVTNEKNSSLTRIADLTLLTAAGREIGVAATKSFEAQLAALYLLALALKKAKSSAPFRHVLKQSAEAEDEEKGFAAEKEWGERAEAEADEKGSAAEEENGEDLLAALEMMPKFAEETLEKIEEIKNFVHDYANAKSVYFIGRGVDYSAALEGSLKLKEISYLPSEGYPAGELKHGTLALIEPGTPVVAILTQRALAEKTMNNVSEVFARGGKILLITPFEEYAARKEVAESFIIPNCIEYFSPILSVIPLQALAYYTSLERGNDPDKPRNLAKSVTVE